MKRILACLLLGVLASCSAKKDAGPDPLASVQGFCHEWATRACNDTVWGNCSAASATKCIEAQQTFCETLVPDGKYSQLTAGACLDAVDAAYKDATLTADERDTVRLLGNECSKIVSGSVGAGGSCKDNGDCNRDVDLACVKKGATGTCAKAKEVGGGVDCSAAEAACASGFYCDEASLHCLEAGKAGIPCSAARPCGPDSKCVGAASGAPPAGGKDGGGDAGAKATTGGSGVCQARQKAGGACKIDDDCTSRICAITGSDSGVCSAKIILSAAEPVCKTLQ
jgi:hypothetical protein